MAMNLEIEDMTDDMSEKTEPFGNMHHLVTVGARPLRRRPQRMAGLASGTPLWIARLCDNETGREIDPAPLVRSARNPLYKGVR
jgi:hypothetical protein